MLIHSHFRGCVLFHLKTNGSITTWDVWMDHKGHKRLKGSKGQKEWRTFREIAILSKCHFVRVCSNRLG